MVLRYNRLNFLILAIFFLSDISIKAQNIVNRCATAEFDKKICEKVASFAKSRMSLNEKVNQLIKNNAKRSLEFELLRIPVVVHVVHNNVGNTIGGAGNSNISEEQIKSQITVLNEDFRKKNGTAGFSNNSASADLKIEFYLADIDPNGNVTDGVTRTYSNKRAYDPTDDADQRALSTLIYWPSICYLNIWVTTLTGTYLGLAQFPSGVYEGIEPDDFDSLEKIDGAFIDHKVFGKKKGTNLPTNNYNGGRTTTHEIGHWLGLIHTWGDSYCGEDYCNDTPQAERDNLSTICKDVYSNCKGVRTRNMTENYMDYTIDSCMNIFTNDQSARIRAVLEVSPRRIQLLECIKKLPESEYLDLQILQNPALKEVKGKILFAGKGDVTIHLVDSQGNLIIKNLYINKSSFSFSMPFNNLPNGIYFVQSFFENQKQIKRILINN